MEARHQRVPGAKEMPARQLSVPVTESVLDKEVVHSVLASRPTPAK
ncbi:hypothetical protein ACVWVZ_000019 [Pseudomonas tolaasii]